MYSYIAKSVFDDHLGSSNDPCYIQNRVITNRVIKRLRCTCITIYAETIPRSSRICRKILGLIQIFSMHFSSHIFSCQSFDVFLYVLVNLSL